MRKLLFVAVCCIALVCECRKYKVTSITSNDLFNTRWSYNESYASKHGLLGPNEWKKDWAFCDADNGHQSPIDIVTTNVTVSDGGILPLTFQTDPCEFDVRNIGPTLSGVAHDFTTCKASFTTSAGKKYHFYEAHFHWNNFWNHRGTEHKVNGQGEAMEAQLVHYDSKFQSIDEAYRDGNVGNIAVVSIRYTVAPTGENATEVPAFDKFIVTDLNRLEYTDLSQEAVVAVGSLSPYDLLGNALPRTNLSMFSYMGSLTVPKCDPIVRWFIVQQTVQLSKSQIQQLRFFKHVNKTTYDTHSLGFEIDSNVRGVVPIADREVIAWPSVVPTNYSSDSGPDDSEEPFFTTTVIIIFACCGGLILLVALIITIVCCCKRKRGGNNEYETIINASA